MAITRLSDLIVPDVFQDYLSLMSTEKNRLVQSGIVGRDPRIDALLAGGGRTFNLPFWNDLANTEANVSTDDPAVTATAQPITTGKDVAIRHNRNQMWGAADLEAALVGEDPMAEIVSKVSGYWRRQDQRTLINSLVGLFADNVANDSSDMVNSIALKAAGTPGASNKISADAVLDTRQTMGDAGDNLVAIAMHSAILTSLKKQNLISFIPASDGKVNFATFMGLSVIEDDGITPYTATQTVHRVFLLGAGAFRWGEGRPKVPIEVERQAIQGRGAGVEYLVSRREYILHPAGYKFVPTSIAGQSPTWAELAAAAQWDRVYDRKLIPLAMLEVNP